MVQESSQEYTVNAEVPQGSLLGPHFSYYIYINDLPDDVICDIGAFLYSNCDQASDLWQQLKLASELESDLRDWALTLSLLLKLPPRKLEP